MHDRYLYEVLSKKIQISSSINGSNSSAAVAALNEKINNLSAIILVLVKIMEIKGIANMDEINSLIEAVMQLDENNDGKINNEDVLKKFGFNNDEMETARRIKATKMAVRNRKLRQMDEQNGLGRRFV